MHKLELIVEDIITLIRFYVYQSKRQKNRPFYMTTLYFGIWQPYGMQTSINVSLRVKIHIYLYGKLLCNDVEAIVYWYHSLFTWISIKIWASYHRAMDITIISTRMHVLIQEHLWAGYIWLLQLKFAALCYMFLCNFT